MTAPHHPHTMDRTRSSPLSQYGGVHGSRAGNPSKTWRNKPLFRREGDARFRTGAEAAEMLINEVKRKDAHEAEYIQAFENAMHVLAPVFERVGPPSGACVPACLPVGRRHQPPESLPSPVNRPPVNRQIPKYAFVAKEFLEAERIIQFRVTWLDDSGTLRMNR